MFTDLTTVTKKTTGLLLALLSAAPLYGADPCEKLFNSELPGARLVERLERAWDGNLKLTPFQAKLTAKQRFRINLAEPALGKDQSFSELMMDPVHGVRALTDKLMKTDLEIPSAEDFVEALEFFASSTVSFNGVFKDPAKGLRELHALMLKEFPSGKCSYLEMESFIGRAAPKVSGYRKKASRVTGKLSPLIALASGHTLLVELPGGFKTFHAGYHDVKAAEREIKLAKKEGREPREIRPAKVGRSYDFDKDATDIQLLRGAAEAVKEGYVMDVIKGNLSFAALSRPEGMGTSAVSKEAATLTTAFINVYIAEMERHATVNLNPQRHPWGTDLVLALIDSVYISASGGRMLVQEPGQTNRSKLIYIRDGRPEFRFAKGTDGTGIGVTRAARMKQQLLKEKAIVSMGGEYAEMVKKLREMIGPTDRKWRGGKEKEIDLLQIYMERVNHPTAEVRRLMREKAHEILPLLYQFIEWQGRPDVIKVINRAIEKEYGKPVELPKPEEKPAE